MTDGKKLKKTLGLDNFKNVYITRIILPHSQKINIVFYDSRRPNSLSKRRCQVPPFIAMAFSGKDLKNGIYEVPVTTPLLDIENWGGDLSQYIIIPVDMAASYTIDAKAFSNLPESVYLMKELTFYDLKDKENISDLTAKWAKDRVRTTGAGNKSIKFIDLVLDEAGNSITFQFLSEATELNGKKPNLELGDYAKYQDPKGEVDPNTFQIKKNPSKTYELQIKVLKFFDWLKIFEGEEITRKELKEILKVADIQVFSTDPSFHWMGNNFNLSQLDGSIYPTDIPNKVWGKRMGGDPQGYFLSKHLYQLFRSIDFFLNPMASKLTKKLKDRNLI